MNDTDVIRIYQNSSNANNLKERKVATDTMHMLERICLLSGVCMEEFETLTVISI